MREYKTKQERTEVKKLEPSSCDVCGGNIVGDGYTIVFHCENVELDLFNLPEPDSNIVCCKNKSELLKKYGN